jgi:monoamine oxidase
LLRRQFPDLLLVEAQDSIGGRIKQARRLSPVCTALQLISMLPQLQVHGLVPWPVELGPEFVHGRHSALVHYAQQLGVTFTEREWPDRRGCQLLQRCTKWSHPAPPVLPA